MSEKGNCIKCLANAIEDYILSTGNEVNSENIDQVTVEESDFVDCAIQHGYIQFDHREVAKNIDAAKDELKSRYMVYEIEKEINKEVPGLFPNKEKARKYDREIE